MARQVFGVRDRWLVALLGFVSVIALFVGHAKAQEQYTPPPPPPPPAQTPTPESTPPPGPLSPKQLDDIVARIALYPDPLLAHILTASSYYDQIPEASQWANEHSYLHGAALADAIRADNLQWNPSVIALLPFPSVLNMMAQDMNWTRELGNAVLTQRAEVMDAVQRLRHKAHEYGYLRSSPYDNVVEAGGDIEILPVNSEYIYVPTYDPFVVFAPPPPGFFIGGAIHFGPAIVIGTWFGPWGWAHPYFDWHAHAIFFDATPWGRVWVNRGFYFHPYAHPFVPRVGPRMEIHHFRR